MSLVIFYLFIYFFSELIPSDSSPFCHFCWLFTQLRAVTDAVQGQTHCLPGARLSPKLSCSHLLWIAGYLGELGYYFFCCCKQALGLESRKLLLGTSKKLQLLGSVPPLRFLARNGSGAGKTTPPYRTAEPTATASHQALCLRGFRFHRSPFPF